jgi:hypothetical protein
MGTLQWRMGLVWAGSMQPSAPRSFSRRGIGRSYGNGGPVTTLPLGREILRGAMPQENVEAICLPGSVTRTSGFPQAA